MITVGGTCTVLVISIEVKCKKGLFTWQGTAFSFFICIKLYFFDCFIRVLPINRPLSCKVEGSLAKLPLLRSFKMENYLSAPLVMDAWRYWQEYDSTVPPESWYDYNCKISKAQLFALLNNPRKSSYRHNSTGATSNAYKSTNTTVWTTDNPGMIIWESGNRKFYYAWEGFWLNVAVLFLRFPSSIFYLPFIYFNNWNAELWFLLVNKHLEPWK